VHDGREALQKVFIFRFHNLKKVFHNLKQVRSMPGVAPAVLPDDLLD
jgi:hypothetical protein